MATQNFSVEVVQAVGGMGGVPPMATAASAPACGLSRGVAAANDESYSRLEKQDSKDFDYVDNL